MLQGQIALCSDTSVLVTSVDDRYWSQKVPTLLRPATLFSNNDEQPCSSWKWVIFIFNLIIIWSITPNRFLISGCLQIVQR